MSFCINWVVTVTLVACAALVGNDCIARSPMSRAVASDANTERAVAPQGNVRHQTGDAWYAGYLFRSGQVLDRVRLHYVTLGRPHHASDGSVDNAVLMLHWTGADGRALTSEEFRRFLFCPGKPLDINRYYVIIPDDIGHGQSSKPSDGLHARFPHYRYADLVDLQHRLVVETLGIRHLRAIIGMSMGGMNAWEWAEDYPDEVGAIMPIVALPAKVSGFNLLWRRWLIDGIRSDPTWSGGDYRRNPQALVGAFQMMEILLDGVPHLQQVAPDQAGADGFLGAARLRAGGVDANDLLYAVDASADYNPGPRLDSIKAKVYALEFSDDEINAGGLSGMLTSIRRVKDARLVMQPSSASSRGHLTIAHPALWAGQVDRFMRFSQ